MPKPRQKPLNDARRRLKTADESLARAQQNVDSMEQVVAEMKSNGDGTGVAEDLLTQFKRAVANRTKTHATADAELKQLEATQGEPQP
jgi:hypothetical protein